MLRDQILAEYLTLQDVETPAFPRADQCLDFIINTENVALHKFLVHNGNSKFRGLSNY